MKPFLLLQIRENDEASNNEMEAFLKFGELKENEIQRVRMEAGGIPEIILEDYSGILMGGGPWNVSDEDEKKSEIQRKSEKQLGELLDEVIENDFPLLGACYGIGALTRHQKGTVSKEKYTEDVGGTDVILTDEGLKDPLTEGLPNKFRAFVGHKEACQGVPEGAVLLANSKPCPVQMIRIKKNVYATQFHPELDVEGLILRINIYKFAGYFPPEDADKLIEEVRKEEVHVPTMILKRFIERFRK